MQVCDKLHSKIVHEDGACPLCNIIKHKNNADKYTISREVYAEWAHIKNMIDVEKTFLSYIDRKIDEEEENETAGD